MLIPMRIQDHAATLTSHRVALLSLPLLLVLTSACGLQRKPPPSDDEGQVPEAGQGGRGGDGREEADERPTREVTCTDQSVSQLMLIDRPASDAIVEEEAGPDGFETLLDATGGGLTPTESFIYLALTEDGMEQLELNDEQAFESGGWHLALRRYVLRLNSGVSGPGDVVGARTVPSTDFETLREVPEDLQYRTEQYFNDSCDYVSDGSGIGAPATALASFWSYSGCLEMTGNVYVLDLGDGRFAKLQVLAYYTPENQMICDATGSVPSPSGAGNVRLRWDLL